MIKEFNRQKLLDNVSTLIQMRGMKIGEVEAAVGISAGYLSRLSKKESDVAPAVDLIWKLAKHLDVSVDALIEGDFSMATDNMEYFETFLKKLIMKIDKNEQEWEAITLADFDKALFGGDPELFIVSECTDTEEIVTRKYGLQLSDSEEEKKKDDILARRRKIDDWRMGKHWCRGIRRIRSDYLPDEKVWMTGTGFKFLLDNSTRMYLFKMVAEVIDPLSPENETGELRTLLIPCYEIYFEEWELPGDFETDRYLPDADDFTWNVYPICNTSLNGINLSGTVDKLYSTMSRHEKDLRLKKSVRSSIDRFMDEKPVILI